MTSTRHRSARPILSWSVALTMLAAVGVAGAQEQTASQQRCILAVNKGARSVAKAQARTNAACLQQASRDHDPAAFASCLTADTRGLLRKSSLKLASIAASKCVELPDFGFTSADAASAGASAQEIGLFHDVFGDDLSTAAVLGASTAEGAACQRAVQTSYEKILQAQLREFGDCKKNGLKSGAIASRASLATCLDAITADARGLVGKAVEKLARASSKRCPGHFGAIPGRCTGFQFLDCVRNAGACRACLILDSADDTGGSCDLIDDDVANMSCPPPTPRPTRTPTPRPTATPRVGCGDGDLDPGEACDDGNLDDGDCCSSTCTFEAPGHACADDRNACTDDVCDGAGACTHASSPSCTGIPLHEHVAADNLVIVYTKTFVPNALGGFDDQDPRDKRSIETVTRVDPTIDFDFAGSGPPGTFFYPYMYSIRWTGGLEAPTTGTYAFELTAAQDGVERLFIDGTLVVEKTAYHPDPVAASVDLTAGRHEIRVDYVNHFFGGVARLHWQPPGEPSLAAIAPSSLYPIADGPTAGGLAATYYATPLFMDKLEQLRKYYRDFRRWMWVNSDLQLDNEFDIRVIDAPLNLSRFDRGFMYPEFTDEESRSVLGDIGELGLDPNAFASIAAWSPPLLTPDSLGHTGLRTGFFAAGATIRSVSGATPTYSSIQTNIIPAEVTEFGLRMMNWYNDEPIVRSDIYPNNHAFEFSSSVPSGFGDSPLFPYNAISFRRPDLQDWELLLAKPGFFRVITRDTDGDGLPDAGSDVPVDEGSFGSNGSSADTDSDGSSDLDELTRGFSQSTDPLQVDTDGDGVSDADDVHPRFAIEEAVLSSTPVQDGTIGASEYGEPFLTVSDPDHPEDFSATLWVTWSAAGLNLAIKVVDESVDPTEYTYVGAYDDGGDNVRVRLDFANDGFFNNPPSVYSDNLEIAVAPSGADDSPMRFAALHHIDANGWVVDYDTVPGSSIPTHWALTSDGYVVEMLVPSNAMIGFTPAACTPFAMQVQVYDRDQRQTSAQLTYQFLREGAVALVHHQDYQCDFPTGFGTGGLGAFANLFLANSIGQNCNHAPTVETTADQTVRIGGAPLRLIVRASDHDRDRLRLSATVDGGQPLTAVQATFEDRGVNLAILRFAPTSVGNHLVTVTATDPDGAIGQSSFQLNATN